MMDRIMVSGAGLAGLIKRSGKGASFVRYYQEGDRLGEPTGNEGWVPDSSVAPLEEEETMGMPTEQGTPGEGAAPGVPGMGGSPPVGEQLWRFARGTTVYAENGTATFRIKNRFEEPDNVLNYEVVVVNDPGNVLQSAGGQPYQEGSFRIPKDSLESIGAQGV